jgi:type IV secretion system protein TrbI
MAKVKAMVPTASRSWLLYGLATMGLVIGTVLIYRQFSGNTIKEQKAEMAKAKEARELGAKTPGNAEAFSTRLEQRRKDVEEAAARARVNAPATTTFTVSGATGTTTIPGGLGGRIVGAAGFPAGKPQGDTPDDAQIDAYARIKEDNLAAQSKKLAEWEDSKGGSGRSGAGTGTGAAGSIEQLMAQVSAAQSGVAAPAPSGSAGLVEAYLKSQNKGDAGAAPGKETQFLKGLEAKGIAAPLTVQAGVGRNSVLEGTAIPVVMRTAVSSDLAGPCRAQVEQDVYDTVTASTKLIPAGSTVICSYSSEVVEGQDRLLLAFTRLIFPNGTSVALGGMQGADEQGKIGANAEVNTRFWRTFGSTFLIAAITRLTERSAPATGVTINTNGGSSGGTAAGVLGDVAKRSLERNLNIKPELSLLPGDRLRVIVTRDMVLDPSITQVR